MVRRAVCLIALSTLVMLGGTLCLAGSVKSSDAPGAPSSPVAPATAPTDQTTPKGTLKVLAGALEAGDKLKLQDLLLAENPTEQKVATAIADMSSALATLRKSALAAYGQDESVAAKLISAKSAVSPEQLAHIDAAREVIEGDTAEVISTSADPVGPAQRVKLKKDGERWKVPMSSRLQGVDPLRVDEQVNEVEAQSKVILNVADEIGDGKFKTAPEAFQAMGEEIMTAALQRNATTNPTTRPVPPGIPTSAPTTTGS